MDPIKMTEIPLPDERTKWENEDYGIRSFDDFLDNDNRNVSEQTFDRLSTFLNGGKKVVNSLYQRGKGLFGHDIETFDGKRSLGQTGSNALVIFFHGLGSDPSNWNNHLSFLSRYPDIDSVAPFIPERGKVDFNGLIFNQFLDRIVDWTIRNPTKPIAFFGHSNGTRIALHFEYLLRKKASQTPVYLSLNAGVLFGSRTVELFSLPDVYSYFEFLPIGYNIYKDLIYGSDSSKRLLFKARKPLKENVAKRCYMMYAPFHDHHVYSLGSALPILNPMMEERKEEHHFIVYQYGHIAIPDGCLEEQLNDCLSWIDESLLINPIID